MEAQTVGRVVQTETKKPKEVATLIDPAKVGSQVAERIKRIKLPALSFRPVMDFAGTFWGAAWYGRTSPIKIIMMGEEQKETIAEKLGRWTFAATFIIADSVWLIGKSGAWLIKKLPWKLRLLNVVIVAGLIVGFLGWVLPAWIGMIGVDVEATKTIKALLQYRMIGSIKFGLPTSWMMGSLLAVVAVVASVSFTRLKKWNGIKSIGKKGRSKLVEPVVD